MCLGIPGQVVSITHDDLSIPMGIITFGGIRREVCLAYTPDVQPGEYVLVHAGFAISQIGEAEAQEVWETLQQLEVDPPGLP